MDRRSIEYYRDPERRGYLVGAPDAPKIKEQYVARPKTMASPLLEDIKRLEVEDKSANAVKVLL
jgi:hypothetical protein